MKLSQLFSSQPYTEEQMNARSKNARNAGSAYLNRQIRSLVPGQTISGEIVGRNGSEVQIKLSEDMVLNARVDKNLNIEIGKNMTFEVKNNGSALMLSPLFTNVSTDVNVLKALEMAALPVNNTSVSMTEQLMEAGLPVNRNSLQQVYREINSFPQLEPQISDIINLHRLQMPVNEVNISQMTSYRNLSHRLLDGMETVLGALEEAAVSVRADGDLSGVMKLYQQLFLLAEEGVGGSEADGSITGQPEENPQEGAAVLQEIRNSVQSGDVVLQGGEVNIAGEAGLQGVQSNAAGEEALQSGQLNVLEGEALPEEGGKPADILTVSGQTDESGVYRVPESLRQGVAEELLALVKDMPLSEEIISEVTGSLNGFATGKADVKQLMAVMSRLTESAGGDEKAMQVLDKMFSQPALKELLNGQLKSMWTLRPEDVAVPGRVEELYRRLDRQLKSLTQVLENAGQTGSAALKALSNLTQNIDFLQQINQMYAYVQLPLRLQQSEAHGELYVYTNKKRLSDGDGKISALLHLDMENLGPVDVYVTLQNSKVNTRFCVQDDEMLDFLADHMELLTERLKRKGYDCSFAMTTRGEKDSPATEGGLEPVLQQEKGVVLSQYAFDVRT